MRLSYDDAKRRKTLSERGIDFDDAPRVFEGFTLTWSDDREDYGELREITVGLLHSQVVIVVWTERKDNRRIISIRKANKDERENYYGELERSR